MDLLQLLNWPLRFVYVLLIRPAARWLSGNPRWPDEPPGSPR